MSQLVYSACQTVKNAVLT